MPKPIAAHLVVSDPEAAATWYARVLGARERNRIALPDGTVLTIEMAVGDTTLALAGEMPDYGITSPKSLGGTGLALIVDTDDANAMWRRALEAGATVFHPIEDTFWGERTGQVIDPFGHRWGFAQHLRDVPHDEVVAKAAEMFGGTSPES